MSHMQVVLPQLVVGRPGPTRIISNKTLKQRALAEEAVELSTQLRQSLARDTSLMQCSPTKNSSEISCEILVVSQNK